MKIALFCLALSTQVYYLDRSANLDSLASVGKWVWYKVGTTSSHVGWIWGYPTGVAEKRDE